MNIIITKKAVRIEARRERIPRWELVVILFAVDSCLRVISISISTSISLFSFRVAWTVVRQPPIEMTARSLFRRWLGTMYLRFHSCGFACRRCLTRHLRPHRMASRWLKAAVTNKRCNLPILLVHSHEKKTGTVGESCYTKRLATRRWSSLRRIVYRYYHDPFPFPWPRHQPPRYGHPQVY